MPTWRGAAACAIGATLLPLLSLASFDPQPFVGVAASRSYVAGQSRAAQSFSGVISDSECDAGSHAQMRMGSDDAECTKACVDAHGASYVLWDGTRAYLLSDQRAPQAHAGRRVVVIGTLDAATRTIAVESITAAR
jgi:hypothetical protein